MQINNITNGSAVKIYAKLDYVNISRSVNQSEFLATQLVDINKDMISAKLWDVDAEIKPILKEGNICYIEGRADEYKGKLQVVISKIRLIDESDDIDPNSFYESSKISIEELQGGIKEHIHQIQNPTIKSIIVKILNEYHEKFFTYPAAKKNHHAFISGLAEHTLGMLKIAMALADLYPFASKDLLIAGVILHDFEKVNEFSSECAPQYTLKGSLVGHLNMGVSTIEKVALDLGIDRSSEEVVMLEHLVLSHHGKPEWGSSKVPMILEAELLHFIDNIDSRTFMIKRELDTVEDGEFTKRVFSLENRNFYKHSIK